ncbi:MAG: hypothetical protein JST01_20350 [Cyanobacteria bacterium SZAS TMP-1]|nr:hypothetical protein [Cyanobacteria bacterium SZAS TMP-1]
MINSLSKVVLKFLFGKSCFAIFAGKNVVGALVCAYSATSVRDLVLKLLPWIGAIILDILWLGIPTFIQLVKRAPQYTRVTA